MVYRQASPESGPPQNSEETLISRRSFLVGAGAALFLASCSSKKSLVKPSVKSSSSKSEASSIETKIPDQPITQPDTSEPLRPTPEFPKLMELPNGSFMGAFIINYKDTKDRPQQPIDDYYRSRKLIRPPMENPFVHQLVASDTNEKGFGVVSEQNLAHGVVIDKGSEGKTIVAGMHNVTQVDAPVHLDGKVFSQTQMGINAVVVPGDEMKVLLPSSVSSHIDSFTFVATRSWMIYPDKQTDVDALFDDNGNDTLRLRTYKCWGEQNRNGVKYVGPGGDSLRLVDEWVLVNAETMPGTVIQGNNGQVGPAQPIL